MSLVAVGVTLGSPDTTAIIPITASNLAAEVTQAVADTATLATNITTAQGAASTADTDMGSLQTSIGTLDSEVDTTVTDATTADNDVGNVTTNYATFLADYDAVAAAICVISGDTYNSGTHQFSTGGSTGLTSAQLHTQMTALNTAIAAFLVAGTTFITFMPDYDAVGAAIVLISGDSYSSSTHLFMTGGSTGLTSSQLHTQMTSLNAAITAFLAAQTFFATLKTATALVKSDALTAQGQSDSVVTSASTTKTATANSLTDANALSTSAISADLTAAQAIIASANVFIQTDTSVTTTLAALSGALVTALAFVKNQSILT